jgi:hypothetical protein
MRVKRRRGREEEEEEVGMTDSKERPAAAPEVEGQQSVEQAGVASGRWVGNAKNKVSVFLDLCKGKVSRASWRDKAM